MAIMEPPEFIEDIAPWVLGDEWPKGDEDAMIRLAEVWETAAKDVDAAMRAADSAVKQARDGFDGPAARQFDEVWAKFVDGDDAAFTRLKDGSEQLADACRSCAVLIEYAKLSIRAALAALGIQVIAMITAAFTTSGGSLAGIMPAQLATRQVILTIFRDLTRRLGEQVDRTLPDRMLLSLATEVAASVAVDTSRTPGRGAISGSFSLESLAQALASDAVSDSTSGNGQHITGAAPKPSPRPRGDDPPQRFTGNLDPTPLPVQTSGDRPEAPPAAGTLPDHPTHFVVDVHATADTIRASGWDGEQPVLLFGRRPGFAAQLARELGGEVTAPDRDAWTDHRGNLFASSSRLGPKDLRPGWPPNGEWTTVEPDGTSTPHGHSSPPGHVPDWRTGDTYRRGAAPGSGNGPTTSPPITAERPQVRRRPHESDATVSAGDARPPKLIAPEGAPLFFANRPDFRASATDVHHMRQSYGLDTWYRDAAGIDDVIARTPYLRSIPRDQLIALRGHTAPPAFKIVNEALRTNDIQTLRRYEGYIKVVNSALNQLPPFHGVVHRVVNTDHPALRASQYRHDSEVTERAFLSGSAAGTGHPPGKVVLQIHSLTGRDVSAIAHRPGEREVLFPSGTRFKVAGTGFDPRTGTYYVQMREVPPAARAQRPVRAQQGPRPVHPGPQFVHSGQSQARPQRPARPQRAVPDRRQATSPLRRPKSPVPQPVPQVTNTVPATRALRGPDFDYGAHRPVAQPLDRCDAGEPMRSTYTTRQIGAETSSE
ncbi:hypothetical protein ALI144C_46240 [Actinosynnema sp. ALI-1.44]|uniref:WXG100-like domain-containing protein n=1 Tax=Actinosynnema sp. ALI-1.44 TaxID=1933779 RepID=UPI00097C6C5E|nr:hypothetical protein [Actinosynnema sp. ALI-1.44]ONI73312.1 hypothetical protein ALI144C_46240 [Actinosynnema sp. ALI-1.44]